MPRRKRRNQRFMWPTVVTLSGTLALSAGAFGNLAEWRDALMAPAWPILPWPVPGDMRATLAELRGLTLRIAGGNTGSTGTNTGSAGAIAQSAPPSGAVAQDRDRLRGEVQSMQLQMARDAKDLAQTRQELATLRARGKPEAPAAGPNARTQPDTPDGTTEAADPAPAASADPSAAAERVSEAAHLASAAAARSGFLSAGRSAVADPVLAAQADPRGAEARQTRADRPSGSQGGPGAGADRPSAPQVGPAAGADRPSPSQGGPAAGADRPSGSQAGPAAGAERPSAPLVGQARAADRAAAAQTATAGSAAVLAGQREAGQHAIASVQRPPPAADAGVAAPPRAAQVASATAAAGQAPNGADNHLSGQALSHLLSARAALMAGRQASARALLTEARPELAVQRTGSGRRKAATQTASASKLGYAIRLINQGNRDGALHEVDQVLASAGVGAAEHVPVR